MINWRHILICVGIVLSLAVVNWQIWAKEQILADGRPVLLKLRPVDPRSLMQGDYMRLRFDDEIFPAKSERPKLSRTGQVILRLDDKGIARFARVADAKPLAGNERRINFKKSYHRHRPDHLQYSAESYFFQEGHGKYLQNARYAVLHVAENGQAVLSGLADELGMPIDLPQND